MAQPADRYPYEQHLPAFEEIVRSAQRTIVAQIEAALAQGDLRSASQRRLQLAAIDATLQQLGAAAVPLAGQLVAEAWHQAADRAQQQIGKLRVVTREQPGVFNGVSREAVTAMQESLAHSLDSARQTLGRRVNDLYAREQRKAAVRALLGAEGSSRRAAKRLRTQLADKGATGFVDSAGRQWKLDTYSNMAIRTVTREAVVQGAIARMASHGIALARVSSHASACEICVPFEGTLVDIGDQGITEYQGEAVSDAAAIPPYHPNCAHSLMPVSATIEQIINAEAEGELQTI